jgi:hypothetical protein
VDHDILSVIFLFWPFYCQSFDLRLHTFLNGEYFVETTNRTVLEHFKRVWLHMKQISEFII